MPTMMYYIQNDSVLCSPTRHILQLQISRNPGDFLRTVKIHEF